MTNEEKDFLKPLIRGIMEEYKGQATDADVARALGKIDQMIKDTGSAYSYQHPDYGAMVKDVPEALQSLIDDGEDVDNVMDFDDMVDVCSNMDKGTLAEAASSIVYFWMNKWHKSDGDEDSVIWAHPMHIAILMIEHFALRECLPVLLEIERQSQGFMNIFFDEDDMAGMPASCICQIATADDLPLLADFVRERGIHSFIKAEVVSAVATLPRRNPELLQPVQQWLCQVLAIFADTLDPQVGDVMLLESIIYCCIHTRCEAAKPIIIRMYSKYKMPNIMIPGGVNEVRKTIKRADIGVIDENKESAEAIYRSADTFQGEYDEDDEDYDDGEEYDEDEDDEDEGEFDDEKLAPRQRYNGWAYGGKAKHLPVKSLQKYTLRIELEMSEPLVWRELEVPSSISLSSLAQAILLAMGWSEDHLHQFVSDGRKCYSTSLNEPFSSFNDGAKRGSSYGISHLLKKEGDDTTFEYDYGDSWRHIVTLKAKSNYADGEKPVVRLTGGANACPPDDCGGIWHYNHLVQLMQKKPNSRELREFYDWLGCKWDSTFFPQKVAAAAVNNMN